MKKRGSYLDRLLQTESVLFTKANTGPFEHLRLFGKVGNGKGLVLGEERLVLARDQVVDFVKQVLAALDPLFSF